MTELGYIWDPENKVDQKYGYYMFFGSIALFGLLNIFVRIIGKPKRVRADSGRWYNLVISWVHGLICGTWDILCIWLYPELLFDLMHHINYFTYLMVAFSAGYFVYDFLELVVRGEVLNNWEVILHHIAVASMFWYNFHSKMCIGFNVIALMAEINSFFLHSRKLLHMLNFEFDNKLYRHVCLANLLTFVVCRGSSLVRLTYALFNDYNLVPRIYFSCCCAAIFVMNVINCVLFWRLFKNDILRPQKAQKLKKEQESKLLLNGNNNQSNHVKSN